MNQNKHEADQRLEIANRVDEVRRLTRDEHDAADVAKAQEDLAEALKEAQDSVKLSDDVG